MSICYARCSAFFNIVCMRLSVQTPVCVSSVSFSYGMFYFIVELNNVPLPGGFEILVCVLPPTGLESQARLSV